MAEEKATVRPARSDDLSAIVELKGLEIRTDHASYDEIDNQYVLWYRSNPVARIPAENVPVRFLNVVRKTVEEAPKSEEGGDE